MNGKPEGIVFSIGLSHAPADWAQQGFISDPLLTYHPDPLDAVLHGAVDVCVTPAWPPSAR
jgi:hypothetical protein